MRYCCVMRLFCALLIFIVMEIGCGKSFSKSKASIPRMKSKRSASNGLISFGEGMIHRLIREAKINFCSDLEGLTLQLTRPTDDIMTTLELEQIVDIVNNQYDNPQLLVGLLVKISRKFAEPNVYTKIKSLLLLHKVVNSSKGDAQTAFARAISSLGKEVDEKTESRFFCVDSIDQLAETASYVVDIEAVELARAYATFVFKFLSLKGDTTGVNKNARKVINTVKSSASTTKRFLDLLTQSEDVEKTCRQSTGPLGQQCLQEIKTDRLWAIDALKQLYNNDVITDIATRDEVERLLTRIDATFKRTIPRPKTIRPVSGGEAVPEVVDRFPQAAAAMKVKTNVKNATTTTARLHSVSAIKPKTQTELKRVK